MLNLTKTSSNVPHLLHENQGKLRGEILKYFIGHDKCTSALFFCWIEETERHFAADR